MKRLITLLLLISLSVTAQRSSKCHMFQGTGEPRNNTALYNWNNSHNGIQKFYWDMDSFQLYVFDYGSSSWVKVPLSNNCCQTQPYKSYVARVTRMSGSNITAQVIYNNTGQTITYTNINPGFDSINFSSPVNADKVALFFDNSEGQLLKTYNSDNITLNRVDNGFVDPKFYNDTLEIRIYN